MALAITHVWSGSGDARPGDRPIREDGSADTKNLRPRGTGTPVGARNLDPARRAEAYPAFFRCRCNRAGCGLLRQRTESGEPFYSGNRVLGPESPWRATPRRELDKENGVT